MTHDDLNTVLLQRTQALVERVKYKPGYEILARRDQADPDGRVYLQVRCWREDTFHPGDYDWGYGGKAYLSPHAVDSEIVQTMFGLCKAYEEHETREWFMFDDRRVYGPHIDVTALWEAAIHLDARPLPERTNDDELDRQGQEDAGQGAAGAGTAPDGQPDHAVVELSIPDSWRAKPPRLAQDSGPRPGR